MISFIALAVVSAIVLYGATNAAKRIESVVKNGTSNPKVAAVAKIAGDAVTDAPNKAPRFVAAALVPVMAFALFACTLSLVCPPQADFNVGNVAWQTRDGGVLGAASDAVLVRTTGASVEPGMLYSTARLSGVEYVSLPGTAWAAVGGEGAADIVGGIYMVVLAGIAAGLTYAGIRGGYTLPKVATAKPALTL